MNQWVLWMVVIFPILLIVVQKGGENMNKKDFSSSVPTWLTVFLGLLALVVTASLWIAARFNFMNMKITELNLMVSVLERDASVKTRKDLQLIKKSYEANVDATKQSYRDWAEAMADQIRISTTTKR